MFGKFRESISGEIQKLTAHFDFKSMTRRRLEKERRESAAWRSANHDYDSALHGRRRIHKNDGTCFTKLDPNVLVEMEQGIIKPPPPLKNGHWFNGH